ncbi:MAG: terpene cyclase/mutase family protein [Pirellulales bacterium]|nr:terpene cyclase/mutase family protein [Pirellulales bacterium]
MTKLLAISTALSLVLGLSDVSVAATDGQDSQEPNYTAMVNSGIEFLASQQADDGSWAAEVGPAVTALATTALLRNGRTPRDPVVANGLKFLEQHIQPDGGIYKRGSRLQNYETCAALMCFIEANAGGKYSEAIAGATKFTRGLQIGLEDADQSKFGYGGAGYGPGSRADLSNTHFFVEALQASGAGADDEAIRRALVFVSRCQNLESEHNTTPFGAKINDGGFYYTADAGGSSAVDAIQGERDPNGGLRSYASMTYAGLKSMIFAGLDQDDQRVKAAMAWIRNHYSLEENPGLGPAGLYYYYQVFAKTLATMKVKTIESADGQQHDWRRDLIAELASRQQKNGAWVNEKSERWMEGNPTLVTCYALLALADCRPTD